MTLLNQVLTGLHETDVKLKDKIVNVSDSVGLSAIQTDGSNKIPILNNDKLINPVYNSTKIAEGINGSGTGQLSMIRFIGNCAIRQSAEGELIIRIGDNLNSSTFNDTDGVTTGTASMSRSTPLSTKITRAADEQSVWKLDGTDAVTVKTDGKIHFDDATNTTFTVKVNANGTTTAYTCGPVTGGGIFGEAPVTLKVSNWAVEGKSAEGATGFEANVTFTIDIDEIVKVEGPVSFEITMTGTNGGKKFSGTVGYIIVDTKTQPSVTNFTAKLTSNATQTYGGITTLKSGTVTYAATVANLNNPATDEQTGASLEIKNDGFAGGVDTVQTTYDGTITKTGTFTTTTKKYASADLDATINVWNINTSATASTKLTDANDNEITAIDFYSGTPNASILGTGNRKTLASTDSSKVAYTDAAAPLSGDLMVYHGELRYPEAFITSNYFANSSYVAPNTTGDKSALFWFSSSGTAKGGTLVIDGFGLMTNVEAVVLGNSVDELLDITSTSGIGTAPSPSATKLTYPFLFKTEGDFITSSTGCWVKITLSGAGAKITKITLVL